MAQPQMPPHTPLDGLSFSVSQAKRNLVGYHVHVAFAVVSLEFQRRIHVRFFEMKLKKVGDIDWPAAGFADEG